MPRPHKVCTLLLVHRQALCSLALAFVGTMGCGPSVQSIHEGSVRFEHCYRLDLDRGIAPPHRHACWKQWIEVYSYGQSRDRIEYARRRVDQIESGDPNPPRLSLATEEVSQNRQFYMSMPAPTSARESPPPIATSLYGPKSREAPGDQCVVRCRTQRQECLLGCEKNDGPKQVPSGTGSGPPLASEPREAATETADNENETSDDSEENAVVGAPSEPACSCEKEYKTCAAGCFR